MLDAEHCYQALKARDRRFDGCFFVGVKTTHIYCRAVCPARTPQKSSCLFFRMPAQAESAGFRACLRCRPEIAPGMVSPQDDSLISRAIFAVRDGFLEDHSVDMLASTLQVSSRHLRRTFQTECGVGIAQFHNSHRLGLAKQLIQDTSLPLTEIAFASGFSSIRRFNDSFREVFRLSPRLMRRKIQPANEANSFTLRIDVRPPFGFFEVLKFLKKRAIDSVEFVSDSSYFRTLRIENCSGEIAASFDPVFHFLRVDISRDLLPVVGHVVAAVKALFDVDARPDVIDAHLSKDPRMRACVRANPGMRVVGVVDAFEVCVRALLGQQVSVAAANTLAKRCVEKFGTPYSSEKNPGKLGRIFPSASQIASRSLSEIQSIGLPRARAFSIQYVSRHFDEILQLVSAQNHAQFINGLLKFPGVGPWTASYLSMRLLRFPDAFLSSDLGVQKAMKRHSSRDCEIQSQAWKPFRSYAVMHLWNSLEDSA